MPEVHTEVTADGAYYMYTTGLTEYRRLELLLVVGSDPNAVTAAAPAFIMLTQRQQATAYPWKEINNDEIVDLPSVGVRARLRTVDANAAYPMPAAVMMYGLQPPMITEVTIENR